MPTGTENNRRGCTEAAANELRKKRRVQRVCCGQYVGGCVQHAALQVLIVGNDSSFVNIYDCGFVALRGFRSAKVPIVRRNWSPNRHLIAGEVCKNDLWVRWNQLIRIYYVTTDSKRGKMYLVSLQKKWKSKHKLYKLYVQTYICIYIIF